MGALGAGHHKWFVSSVSVLAVLLHSASMLGQSPTPPLVTLEKLTVPKDRLPEGCAIKPIQPDAKPFKSTVPGLLPSEVTANPWIGTDRRILASLRELVDGPNAIRPPDAPPLSQSESSALLLRLADGVDEGYAATYAQAGPDLGVIALRFSSAHEVDLDLPRANSKGAGNTALQIGQIRVVVYGDGGRCSDAITGYVKSLR
jgi:hypothetical protein